jgi:hypothetical protein
MNRPSFKNSHLKNPTKHIGLILVSMISFLCAIVLLLIRSISSNGNENEWLLRKESTAISCNKSDSAEPGSSGDKNNSGGCAHQVGASCLLTISAEKRNKTHTC